MGMKGKPLNTVSKHFCLVPRKSPKLLTRDQDTLLRAELLRLADELQPITVRGLYYQSVVSTALEFITKDSLGSTTNYDLVQRRVLDLRKSGEMPWEWVVDESRASYGVNRWNNPVGFAETAPWFYRLDFWRGAVRPVVVVEKAGQIPVYLQHARDLGIDVVACKATAQPVTSAAWRSSWRNTSVKGKPLSCWSALRPQW